MTPKLGLQARATPFSFVPRFILYLLISAAPLLAQEHYLAAGHPDAIALLPPPPAPGSAEQAADLASAKAVFGGRSGVEEQRAVADDSLAFSLFRPAIGPAFRLDRLPKTKALLEKVKADTGGAIDTPKNYFKRLRPYQVDGHLALGKPDPSFSYPSGHSTRGTVYSLVLVELFPEKKDVILQIGRDIGWDRVVIGKHYPTDVYAGRVLGQAIVRELMANPAFQRDFADAKSEIAQSKAKSPVGE